MKGTEARRRGGTEARRGGIEASGLRGMEGWTASTSGQHMLMREICGSRKNAEDARSRVGRATQRVKPTAPVCYCH